MTSSDVTHFPNDERRLVQWSSGTVLARGATDSGFETRLEHSYAISENGFPVFNRFSMPQKNVFQGRAIWLNFIFGRCTACWSSGMILA